MNPPISTVLRFSDIFSKDIDWHRDWVAVPENMLDIHRFVFGSIDGSGLFALMSTSEGYIQTVLNATEEVQRFLDEQDMFTVNKILYPFYTNGEGGHDTGHAWRDFLRHAIMMARPEYQKMHIAEQVATAQATGHDIGTSLVPRYIDGKIVGHAEVGAYYYYIVLNKLGYPNLASLVAWFIAGHTVYLSEKEYTATELSGSPVLVRLPYPAFIHDDGKQQFGAGMTLTRRLDASSMGIFMAIRHIVANVIGATKEGAQDRLGNSTDPVELNAAQALAVLTPSMEAREENTTTTFAHITGFLSSRHPAQGGKAVNGWNYFDAHFPGMGKMLVANGKLWVNDILPAVENATAQPEVDRTEVWLQLAKLLVQCNITPEIVEALKTVHFFWKQIPQDDVNRWAQILPVLQEAYDDSLESYYEQALKATSDEVTGQLGTTVHAIILEASAVLFPEQEFLEKTAKLSLKK